MSVQIYHNPRCSKSRETLALLEENGFQFETILYLDTPPSIAVLKDILKMLGMSSAQDLMRKNELVYKELDLKTETNETVLLQAMIDNPKLIERPIVIVDGMAQIGRPPESVLALFE